MSSTIRSDLSRRGDWQHSPSVEASAGFLLFVMSGQSGPPTVYAQVYRPGSHALEVHDLIFENDEAKLVLPFKAGKARIPIDRTKLQALCSAIKGRFVHLVYHGVVDLRLFAESTLCMPAISHEEKI